MNWLKKDAVNRLWRTFWQAVGGTILVGLGDVGYQILDYFLASSAGKVVDWGEVWTWAGRAAVMAVVVPVLAYLHRTKLDPSSVPSLTPPLPTPTLPKEA
jgi:hypothetical protein